MRTWRQTIVGLTLAIWVGAAAAQATAPASVTLNIEPQPLGDALMKFAEQAGLQVLLFAEVSEGLTAPQVQGTYEPQAALKLLLGSSGLDYEYLNERTIAIRAPKSGAAPLPKISDVDAANPTEALRLAQSSEASASQTDAAASPAAEGGESSVLLEEVVVTGTHIRGVTGPTGSPLTVYDRETIDKSGVATVEQFLRTIPQNFSLADSGTFTSGQGEAVNNNSFGTSVNLRGLGSTATLTLLNGHRLAPGGVDGSMVDVSTIPLAAVERIEVLTDGASAVYGADAVAGVVNFVLRKNYTGAETSLRYGDTADGGGLERDFSQLLGTSWQGGSVMLAYQHHGQEGVRAGQRDFIPIIGDMDPGLDILPKQETDSVFLAGRQELSDRVSVSADAFYGVRDFAQDSILATSTAFSEGSSRQSGAVLGFGYAFGKDWKLDFEGGYTRAKQDSNTDIVGLFAVTGGNISDTTSLDLRVGGSVWAMTGGTARGSFGASTRREEWRVFAANPFASCNPCVNPDRRVTSAFAEFLLPLIGEANARGGARRLELSLAGRFDDYDDFGSSVNPKIGLLWQPLKELSLRGSYGTSFRAPLLSQLDSDPNAAFPTNQATIATDLNGDTSIMLIRSALTNPELDAETSRSFTVGFDYRPQAVPGFSLSTTYFHIKFDDRISFPPVVGDLRTVLSQPALQPLIDRAPDLSEINQLLAEAPIIFDPAEFPPGQFPDGPTAEDITVIFDARLHNISETTESGIEFSGTYGFDLEAGHLTFTLAGDYLLELENRVAAGVAALDLVNKTYQPMDLKLRGGASWEQRGFGATLFLNYANSYDNDLIVPTGRIDSWTTADLQLSYRTGERWAGSFLNDVTASLSVLNLTGEDPPRVARVFSPFLADMAYDASNASPRGRFIALQASKRW